MVDLAKFFETHEQIHPSLTRNLPTATTFQDPKTFPSEEVDGRLGNPLENCSNSSEYGISRDPNEFTGGWKSTCY